MERPLFIKDSRRRRGWFWLDNEVFEVDLDPYSFKVYAYLVRIADRCSEVATISTRKLAEKLKMSRQRVRKALKTLEEKGLIIKKQRVSENGNYYANLYILTDKESWRFPQEESGLRDSPRWTTTQPTVDREVAHDGLSGSPPPASSEPKSLENQGESLGEHLPIKNTDNQEYRNNKDIIPASYEAGGEENKVSKKRRDSKNKEKEKEINAWRRFLVRLVHRGTLKKTGEGLEDFAKAMNVVKPFAKYLMQKHKKGELPPEKLLGRALYAVAYYLCTPLGLAGVFGRPEDTVKNIKRELEANSRLAQQIKFIASQLQEDALKVLKEELPQVYETATGSVR